MTVPTLHIQPLAIQYIYIQESNLHWENFCREISERKALLFFQKKSIHDPAGAKMHSQVHHKSE